MTTSVPFRLLLAATVFMLLGTACGDADVGTGDAPTIAVLEPLPYQIVRQVPLEVHGTIRGNVTGVDLRVDDAAPVRARPGEDAGTWRLDEVGTALGIGVHILVATATGPGGTARFQTAFLYDPAASGVVPAFVPDRVTIQPGSESRVVFAVFGDGQSEEVEPSLQAPPDGFVVTGFPDRIRTGAGVDLDVAVSSTVPVGDYELVVTTADGARAVLAVSVGTAPDPTTATTVAPGSTTTVPRTTLPPTDPDAESYEVDSEVTASDTGGVGATGRAVWLLRFGCDDGRCDAVVTNGGPRGRLERFTLSYVATEELYEFNFDIGNPTSQCPSNPVTGSVVPTAWDERGPLEFTYELSSELQCAGETTTVTWEGTGRRL